MNSSKIIATGSYLPKKILTNNDIANIVETSDEWITTRTGIKKRHISSNEETTAFMATKAAQDAINNSDINASDIDLIIVSTTTADLTFPSVATHVQANLEIDNCPSFDVQAVCSGFIYGLSIADSFIKSGQHKNILIIGAEQMSSIINWDDRNTCVLFGDGAGAVILSQTKEANTGILKTILHSNGSHSEILKTSGGIGSSGTSGKIEMSGKDVFKHAVSKMSQSIIDIAKATSIELSQIDLIIPHQANSRIIDKISDKLNFDKEKIILTVDQHANTSAASIPLAMDYANKQGKLKEGNIIALTALGGGLTWGSAILVL